MAQMTIVTTRTLHVEGKGNVPFRFDANGAALAGNYDIVEVAPGTPVTLDAAEAERILAKFGGSEVKPSQSAHAASIADETAPPIPAGPSTETNIEDPALAAAAAKASRK